MGLLGISRFWRRKSTLFALVCLAALLVLCVELNSSKSSNKSNRLVQKAQNFYYSEKAEGRIYEHPAVHGDPNNPDVFDQDHRGIRFVEGGRIRGKPEPVNANRDQEQDQDHVSIKPKKIVFQEDEIEYYKRKNKLLYAAKAEQAKVRNKLAKSKAKVHISHNNFQPYNEDETELGNGNEKDKYQVQSLNDNLPQPVYRGDFNYQGDNGVVEDKPPYIPKHRIVHFDLKGAPPKVSFILKVLESAKSMGATGVLMEYEDMFPYEGRLAKVVAKNHYTKKDIEDILKKCEELGLEVIPLVQTFGHLEFVLKLEEFSYLRDRYDMPESICPCHPEAMDLVKELVDQTVKMHPKSKYLHIGCDEVFHLGECEQCMGKSRSNIFIDHVVAVASYAKKTYPHLESPLIWDDMLRNFLSAEMQPLANLVTPMIWVYAENVEYFMPYWSFKSYSEVFNTAWTASAFKGAHGPTLTAPDIYRLLQNNLNWLKVMQNEESKFVDGFTGIVLTGWQRFDHFAVLCEILPVAVPSMGINLVATSHGYFNTTNQPVLMKGLECVGAHRNLETPLELERDPYLFDKMSWCFFPGAPVFKMVVKLNRTQEMILTYSKKVRKDQGWLTDYNIRNNYSTPFRMEELMAEWPEHRRSLVDITHSANQVLSDVFDEYTVSEWIEQNIFPYYQDLMSMKKQADAFVNARAVWPRRPLPRAMEVDQAFKEMGVKPGVVPEVSKTENERPLYHNYNPSGQGYSEVVHVNSMNSRRDVVLGEQDESDPDDTKGPLIEGRHRIAYVDGH